MKTKKILTSLALLASLGMGTAAYAAPPPLENDGFGAPPHHFNRPPKNFKRDGAKLEEKLKLTPEQKQLAKVNRENGREKMRPIMKKMAKKRYEIDKIMLSNLSEEVKHQKIEAIKNEMHPLKIQADKIRKENMEAFEAILTPAQKAEFDKIKAEKKKEMDKRRAEFEKNHPRRAPKN